MLPSAARRPTCGKAMNGFGNICLSECFGASLSLVESFSVEVCCSLGCWCRLLAEESAFGNDEMTKQTFYGEGAHGRVSWPLRTTGSCGLPDSLHKLRDGISAHRHQRAAGRPSPLRRSPHGWGGGTHRLGTPRSYDPKRTGGAVVVWCADDRRLPPWRFLRRHRQRGEGVVLEILWGSVS